MAARQGALVLLNDPVAEELLRSTSPALAGDHDRHRLGAYPPLVRDAATGAKLIVYR